MFDPEGKTIAPPPRIKWSATNPVLSCVKIIVGMLPGLTLVFITLNVPLFAQAETEENKIENHY